MDYSFISEVQQIQNSIEKLKEKFQDNSSTKIILDGLIVNSLGQLFAMEVHKVELNEGDGIHHGKTPEGKLIRITTTQGKSAILKNGTEQLLVLLLEAKGQFKTIYFGSGVKAWGKDNGKTVKTKRISISTLESL